MKEGRVLSIGALAYDTAQYTGANTSGWLPMDDKVLIMIDVVANQTGSIIVPEDTQERNTMSAEHGVIIALGPAAFKHSDDGRRVWEGTRPEPGTRCYIERYAGQLVKGLDGRMYRLMSQRCIGAIADPAALAMTQAA